MDKDNPRLAAEIALRHHVTAILRSDSQLARFIDHIDGPQGRPAAGRTLDISIIEASDWSGGSFSGREVLLLLSLQDDARDDSGLGRALAIIDQTLQTIADDIPGWRIVNLQPLARRILRGSDARWRALGRYRVRMIADNI